MIAHAELGYWSKGGGDDGKDDDDHNKNDDDRGRRTRIREGFTSYL